MQGIAERVLQRERTMSRALVSGLHASALLQRLVAASRQRGAVDRVVKTTQSRGDSASLRAFRVPAGTRLVLPKVMDDGATVRAADDEWAECVGGGPQKQW